MYMYIVIVISERFIHKIRTVGQTGDKFQCGNVTSLLTM